MTRLANDHPRRPADLFRRKGPRFRPSVDRFEERTLLSGLSFLQGFATVTGAQGTLPKPNAIINLYDSTGTNLIRSTTTNADGYYRFQDVAPGTYTLTETTAGFNTTGVSISSTINPGTAVNVNGEKAIRVTVKDPSSQVLTLSPNQGPYDALTAKFVLNASATNAAGPFNGSTINGDTVGQFNMNLGGSLGNTNPILTLCSDLFNALEPGALYGVKPALTPSTTTLTTNLGRIGYLYNRFGQFVQNADPGFDAAVNGAGLQLAIWELLYDSTPNLFGGNFVVSGADAGVLAAASNYINVSAGKSESVYFLNFLGSIQGGGQGMLSTDLFNFNNEPILTSSISGKVYEDVNANGLFNPGVDIPIPGVTITLTNGVTRTATTDSSGNYRFDNLTPGTYTITETQPAGYLQGVTNANATGGVNVGTPFGGTVLVQDQISNIVVTPGKDGVEYNFGELKPVRFGGVIFVDANGDCIKQADEPGLGNVPVTLSGFDVYGNAISVSTSTSANGTYAFNDANGTPLAPGTYAITQGTLPAGFSPGGSTSTTPGAVLTPTQISNLVLNSGANSPANNFCVELGSSIDIEKFVKEIPMGGGGDLCDTLGKPTALTFQYIPSNTFNSLQPADKSKVIANNGLDDDDTAYIVVSDRSSNPTSGAVYFQGNVRVGETFVASAVGGKFAANSYIYIYDSQGGPLLQQVQYHTSCSAPIVLGAQPLSATLVGYQGANGSASLPTDGGDLGVSVDDPANAPTFTAGASLQFSFVVTNTGAAPITDVQVVDDNATPGNTGDDFAPAPVLVNGFNTGDTNKNNVLDPGEKWLYRSTGTAAPANSTVCNTAAVSGLVVGTSQRVSDADTACYNTTVPRVDVCTTGQKPKVLVMLYDPNDPNSNTVSNTQGGKASVTNNAPLAQNVRIKVTDKSNANDKKAKTFFDGQVSAGQTFAIDATKGGASRLPADSYIHIFDLNGRLLQTVKFHTSCSQPLFLTDQFGGAELVGFVGEKGATLGDTNPNVR